MSRCAVSLLLLSLSLLLLLLSVASSPQFQACWHPGFCFPFLRILLLFVKFNQGLKLSLWWCCCWWWFFFSPLFFVVPYSLSFTEHQSSRYSSSKSNIAVTPSVYVLLLRGPLPNLLLLLLRLSPCCCSEVACFLTISSLETWLTYTMKKLSLSFLALASASSPSSSLLLLLLFFFGSPLLAAPLASTLELTDTQRQKKPNKTSKSSIQLMSLMGVKET